MQNFTIRAERLRLSSSVDHFRRSSIYSF